MLAQKQHKSCIIIKDNNTKIKKEITTKTRWGYKII